MTQKTVAQRHQQRYGDYDIAAGVKTDIEKLLTQFTETKSIRYEVFVELWKRSGIGLIYGGRNRDNELVEFTEELLGIASNYWFPPYSFQVRVGALFLLYGLYCKQPCDIPVKIRLTKEYWKEVQSFLEEVRQQQHLDVEYIFHKLRFRKAFHFVAKKNYMILHHKIINDETTGREDIRPQEENSVLSEVFEAEIIDQLSSIHDQYHHKKLQVSNTGGDKLLPSINVIQENLVQRITRVITLYEDFRKGKSTKKGSRKRKDSGGFTTSESEGDSDNEQRSTQSDGSAGSGRKKLSIGDRRAAIRDRAFTAVPTAAKSRRHRQNVKESSDSDALLSPVAGGSKGKKRKQLSNEDSPPKPTKKRLKPGEKLLSDDLNQSTDFSSEDLLSPPRALPQSHSVEETSMPDIFAPFTALTEEVEPVFSPPGSKGKGKGKGKNKTSPGSLKQTPTPAKVSSSKDKTQEDPKATPKQSCKKKGKAKTPNTSGVKKISPKQNQSKKTSEEKDKGKLNKNSPESNVNPKSKDTVKKPAPDIDDDNLASPPVSRTPSLKGKKKTANKGKVGSDVKETDIVSESPVTKQKQKDSAFKEPDISYNSPVLKQKPKGSLTRVTDAVSESPVTKRKSKGSASEKTDVSESPATKQRQKVATPSPLATSSKQTKSTPTAKAKNTKSKPGEKTLNDSRESLNLSMQDGVLDKSDASMENDAGDKAANDKETPKRGRGRPKKKKN